MLQTFDGKNPEARGQERRKPRILVAPLDWGLGHATRCIPLVEELLAQGGDVWIAAEGAQEQLLKTEFPNIPFLPLKGYKAKYARSKTGMLWQILVQSPRFLRTIKNEHVWLKKAVAEHGFNAVISDNRFGLWHSEIPCIFITHQLLIKSPLGNWSEKLLQGRSYKFIKNFTQCWVPDSTNNNGLAGELSHPTKMPETPVRYIGPMSRFQSNGVSEMKGHLLIILSGPEPQRTILENKLIQQVSNYIGTVTFVRGLPSAETMIPSTNMPRFYNHLSASALNQEMERAEYIISRSGYSTVMDVAVLQKKSILVPTPGQTEQEYLAQYLSGKQLAFSVKQDEISLEKNLEEARRFTYRLDGFKQGSSIKEAIAGLLAIV